MSEDIRTDDLFEGWTCIGKGVAGNRLTVQNGETIVGIVNHNLEFTE